MDSAVSGRVVVGVDGTEQGLLAVRYGVREAQRLGCGLLLAHAMPEVVPMAPMMPVVGVETFAEAGHRVLRRARHVAEEMAGPGLAIDEMLRGGSRVHLLVGCSEDARAVVVGRHDRSALGRMFIGSTSAGVATRAHCPVVSVPASWSADRVSGGVVVGVEDPEHAFEVVSKGFAEAFRRGAPLTVLHTWKLPAPYDEVFAARLAPDEWRAAVADKLEAAIRDLRADYPEVDVQLDVRHQEPAAALLGASEGAALLVLGRHGRGAPFGLHLGSVARTLIREARCPVEVTPMHAWTAEGLAQELRMTAGELAPQT